jgi:hypothetical protein
MSPAAELLKSAPVNRRFDFSLRAIQPSLIIAHGVPAATYVQEDQAAQ